MRSGFLEAVILAEGSVLAVSIRRVEGLPELLIGDIGEPLEEEEREDIGLEVGGVDRAAQDIRASHR